MNGEHAVREVFRINAAQASLSLNTAMLAVDKAVEAGHLRRNLRWAMSKAQRLSLIDLAIWLKSAAIVQALETGSGFDEGIFLGIPYSVEDGVPDDTIWLEVVRPTVIGEIHCLPIPPGYGQ